jgi:tetratricopeptide (TPR) repeat protein
MTGFKAHHNLALVYQDMGRWPDAEAQFRASVTKAPGFVPSWLGLSDLYLKLGQLRNAESVASRLDTLAPEEAAQLRGLLASIGANAGR